MDTDATSGEPASRPRHRPARPTTGAQFFTWTNHQVWALEAGTGQSLYLPAQGAGEPAGPDGRTWKQRAKAGELLCPYPACGVAYSHARGGLDRHCFVHPRGGGNHNDPATREKLWHRTAKKTMARWAAEQFPSSTVHVDDVRLRLPDKSWRQPDVLVDLGSRRLAIECQYSALDEVAWRDRHTFYAGADVVDIWLFGHVGPHAQRRRSGRVALLELHKAMLRCGVIPLWLDPFTETVATPHAPRRPRLVAVGL